MGTDKGLLEFHGHTWIEHQAQQIRDSKCIERLILVDQPSKSCLYDRLLTPLGPAGMRNHMAENARQDSQPFDSIFIGLEQIPPGQGTFISPIDVPLSQKLISQIWQRCQDDVDAVKPSYQHQGGHPIWLGPKAIEKFKAKPRRLDEFLTELQVQYVEVPDSRIRLNLNTPEEWRSFVYSAADPEK